jgi:hypothetical protein
MSGIDLTSYAPLMIIGLFALSVGLLFLMRDTTEVPPHEGSRWVRCPRYDQPARVDYIERVHTGLTIRNVRDCPLRHAGAKCRDECMWDA